MKKVFTIVLVLAFSITNAQTPIFYQDFQSGAVSYYVNNGMSAEDASHLNGVQNNGSNFARSTVAGADGNRLQLQKIAYGAGSWMTRSTVLKSIAPRFLKIQFVMNVSGTQTSATAFNAHGSFVVGSGSGIDPVKLNANFPAASATHSMFYFHFPSPAAGDGGAFPGFSLVSDTTAIGSPTVFSGDQELTILINNSGSSSSYLDPLGNVSTLSNDKMDVWVGTTQVFNEKSAVTPASDIDGFKFTWSPSIPNGTTLQFDNLTIYDEEVATLPVTFSSFGVSKTTIGSALLSWKTLSEHNNSYYEILRSETGNDFEVIGTIPSNANSNKIQQYSFDDINPFNGINYYKLKQVDLDGESSEHKEIVSVDMFNQKRKFVVYRKDAENIAINVYSNEAKKSTITVLDLSGRVLKEYTSNLVKGYNDINIPFTGKTGVYVVSLSSFGSIQTSKFIAP